ncbi:carboxymuconolactone decarboxylase family protein [Actinomadura barringtoniae]|uniref:Carboxymuconolactone decarboxylase family protein n=1 Tax=Actinomadura barringtoniae TaxID=1427535 RepID=A0A939T7T3_9ACTN|nr:carboxymuconolactone decarboxylase family protein [Actinomadura barringtoniae]MBO2449617.1 carboxymuconolactone decarboxylase family protein [Actinomadura barringtoniae]
MQGFPLIQPETATGEAASLLDATQHVFGITPNMIKAMANSPAALRGYLGLAGALREGSLPMAVRERIALLVAQHHGSDYCLSAHTYVATKLAGLTETEATRARSGEADDPVAAAALMLAAAMLRRNGSVTADELSAGRAAGLAPEQIVEVAAHVALNVFTNHVTNATRVAVDWPLVRHTD